MPPMWEKVPCSSLRKSALTLGPWGRREEPAEDPRSRGPLPAERDAARARARGREGRARRGARCALGRPARSRRRGRVTRARSCVRVCACAGARAQNLVSEVLEPRLRARRRSPEPGHARDGRTRRSRPPHGGAAKSLREARWSDIWCRGGARRLPWQNAMRMPRLIGMLRPGESIVRTSKPLDFPRDHAKLVRRAWVPEELAAALGGLPAGSPEPPRRGSPERRREAAAKAAAALFGEQTRGDQEGWRGAAARSRAQALAVSARRPVTTPLPDDCERARAGATYEHDATYPPSEALAINATPKAWGFHCRAGAWSEDPVCELAFRPSMAEGGAGACRGAAAA